MCTHGESYGGGSEIDFVCVYMVVGMYVSDGCMLVMILDHEK